MRHPGSHSPPPRGRPGDHTVAKSVEQPLQALTMVVHYDVLRFSGNAATRGLHQHRAVTGNEEGGEQSPVGREGWILFELSGEHPLEVGADLPGTGDQRGRSRDRAEEGASARPIARVLVALFWPRVQT